MQLTENQITQANALIKKYKFCSFETQKRLQGAGFFEKVKVNWCLRKNTIMQIIDSEGLVTTGINADYLILMPQFHEVWEALPEKIKSLTYKKNSLPYSKLELTPASIHYVNANGWSPLIWIEDKNITEAACLLWLKLKEQNLL